MRFSVPQFIKPHDLDDLMPYLPTAAIAQEMVDHLHPMDVDAPREAGAKALEKMAAFHQAADSVFRKHADRLSRAYEIIAPSEAEEGAEEGRFSMTLREIALKIFQTRDSDKLTPAMLWAVHRAIIQTQNIITDKINFRQNMIYNILPKKNLADIIKVRDWSRSLQEDIVDKTTNLITIDPAEKEALRRKNPIFTFAIKARKAIERSRRTRALSPDGYLGPSSIKIEPKGPAMQTYKIKDMETFTVNERIIIRFLDAWVTSRYLNRSTNLAAIGPLILRAVGKYDGFDLDESIGFTFLQEIGVITPWENRAAYGIKILWRSGHDNKPARPRDKVSDTASVECNTTGDPKDVMKDLRKDWADLPVFCIDGADTLERDDGFSLEPVIGNNTEHWVHIHVANPSAILTPDSTIAGYAAHLSEAVYFPERRYPMLPPDLTARYLSLADGRPCLTFSARMTMEGDILEREITSGIVNNVLHLTPRTVGKAMGMEKDGNAEASAFKSILSLGGEIPTRPEPQEQESEKPFTSYHADLLRKLMTLGTASRRRRTRNGAIEFGSSAKITSSFSQVLLEKPNPPTPRVIDHGIRLFEGDPMITIRRRTDSLGPIQKLVSDMMILAGQICASWCQERNIPIPYRGIMRNPQPASSPKIFKREVIDSSVAKTGHASQWDLWHYLKLLGQPAISASPLEHFALGLPAYCKTTSPLRRYVDLFTHWQVEAALRYEAETGSSLIGSADDSYLPFSRSAVEAFTNLALLNERRLGTAAQEARKHWLVQALFRAFYFNEAELPETFEVTALMPYKTLPQGWLNDWDARVTLPIMSDAAFEVGGVQPGDLWETKISSIRPYTKQIVMTPIRLIERNAQIGEVGRVFKT